MGQLLCGDGGGAVPLTQQSQSLGWVLLISPDWLPPQKQLDWLMLRFKDTTLLKGAVQLHLQDHELVPLVKLTHWQDCLFVALEH